MGHVPHLLVPGPWDDERIEPEPAQRRHLIDVLRRSDGAEVSYTDGAGRRGIGAWIDGFIQRGDEQSEPTPTSWLALAVAPPDSKDRVRWLVEKSTELGVGRLRWIQTTYGQGRLPPVARTHGWMIAALQQSRRAFVMEIDSSWSRFDDLTNVVVADQSGVRFAPGIVHGQTGEYTVAIGPEGGWAPDEISESVTRVSLGDGVLRTETAAIAVAAILAAERAS